MAIRIIRTEGDEILKKISKPVKTIDKKNKELIKDMIETMHKNNGLGLAAVQVGILKRIIVVDLYEEGKEPYILINPIIKKTDGKHILDEGCLSFPNQFAKVERPEKVVVEALNEKGEKIKIEAKDLLAQALCHETDHLNGIVFTEKMIPGTLEILTEEEKNKKRETKLKKG